MQLTTPLEPPALRQRLVAWAVTLTANTPLAPSPYERQLLDDYQQGWLTLDEMEELLALSVYHVLYHSRATQLPSEADLQALLAWSRAYNAQHGITGLLLYSDGCFVQALEGPAPQVQALYARIQQDTRHEQVTTVRAEPGPARRFADWRMGFGRVDAPALGQVLDALQAAQSEPALPVEVPHLQALLAAFRSRPVESVGARV